MIVYKTFEEITQDMLPYKHHRVVDDVRMIREVAITPTVWQRLKYYLLGERAPATAIVPRQDVRITPTCLYAHPEVAAALRLRLLRISPKENPLKDI